MICECACNQIEQLKNQLRQHELTIVQLVEIVGHNNRIISELIKDNNMSTKVVTPHS